MSQAINPRFVVVTRSTQAPQCRGGKFRRPVHVRVLDATLSEWHAVRGHNDGVRFERRNVDSRYAGPRSEYGQALARANEVAEGLNRDHALGLLDAILGGGKGGAA